ncbi:hypothetical protein [Pyramidobacter sp.]|uniref:hypothetical protein n=1 Tax=Pyramidobacter sp. TaxID=1943581 RepID=UPI0033185F5F
MVLHDVPRLVITVKMEPGVGSFFYREKQKTQTFGIKGLRFFIVKRKPPAVPVVPKGFSYGEKGLLLW